mmetsp:Transcript_101960/g.327187  ORF Transcript_101960/g.327187 Transcript_101960/m.327187 type:complete len:231 (+) Transcript_101960:766-1458(+)
MTKVLDECGVGNPTDGISACMTEGIKQNSEGIKLNSAGIEQNREGIELNSEGNVQGSSGTTPESAKTTERDFDDQQWNTGIGMPEQWSTVSCGHRCCQASRSARGCECQENARHVRLEAEGVPNTMKTQEEHELMDGQMVEMRRVDGVTTWPWNKVKQAVEAVFGLALRRETACESSGKEEQSTEVDDNMVVSGEGSQGPMGSTTGTVTTRRPAASTRRSSSASVSWRLG